MFVLKRHQNALIGINILLHGSLDSKYIVTSNICDNCIMYNVWMCFLYINIFQYYSCFCVFDCNSSIKKTCLCLQLIYYEYQLICKEYAVILYLIILQRVVYIYIVQGDTFFKDLLRYPLASEGVYAPFGPVFLDHTI